MERRSLGAILTGLMVLLFLRDIRSALIVVVTIPFSILSAVVCLWMAGQTINIMTLGGLALAVGVLVDEATVLIESVHTHLTAGASPARAALDASQQTITPRLLAMLCVLSVFIPAFFMVGAGRQLFVPLSLAVAFAMISSYVLSSTHRADSLYLGVEARAASGPGILPTPPVRLSRAAQERSERYGGSLWAGICSSRH